MRDEVRTRCSTMHAPYPPPCMHSLRLGLGVAPCMYLCMRATYTEMRLEEKEEKEREQEDSYG